MKLLNTRGASAARAANSYVRSQLARSVSEFENDIRKLYLRTIDEPIPSRLMDVLRAGLNGNKSEA